MTHRVINACRTDTRPMPEAQRQMTYGRIEPLAYPRQSWAKAIGGTVLFLSGCFVLAMLAAVLP